MEPRNTQNRLIRALSVHKMMEHWFDIRGGEHMLVELANPLGSNRQMIIDLPKDAQYFQFRTWNPKTRQWDTIVHGGAVKLVKNMKHDGQVFRLFPNRIYEKKVFGDRNFLYIDRENMVMVNCSKRWNKDWIASPADKIVH